MSLKGDAGLVERSSMLAALTFVVEVNDAKDLEFLKSKEILKTESVVGALTNGTFNLAVCVVPS